MSEELPEEGDTPSDVPEESLETNTLILEAMRQLSLEGKDFHAVISDADLVRALATARRKVSESFPASIPDVRYTYNDPEIGLTTAVVPPKLVLILAETCHAIRNRLADTWKEDPENNEAQELFHENEVPSAEAMKQLLPDDETASVQDRVKQLLKLCIEFDHEGIDRDLLEGPDPDPLELQGQLHLGGSALEAASSIYGGVRDRLKRIYSIPPVRIVRSMREWRQWSDRIQTATMEDVPDIHSLYEGVMIDTERLIRLDPRFGTPEQFMDVVQFVRGHGAMFKALKSEGSDDEVIEGITKGHIAIVREEPQADASPNEKPPLLGFYNVLAEPDAVREHMRGELHFSSNSQFANTSDLPRFSRFEEATGEMRTIAYSHEEGALHAFRLAKEGKLAWSVDHAVRMNGPEKIQRYAQLGTALKIAEYATLRDQLGKTHALMKIATVIGVDATAAATERGIEYSLPSQEWNEKGVTTWNVDPSGILTLHRPISNVGSKVLNERLGADEVMTVTEEFERDGIKVRILWRYLLQPFPPELP